MKNNDGESVRPKEKKEAETSVLMSEGGTNLDRHFRQFAPKYIVAGDLKIIVDVCLCRRRIVQMALKFKSYCSEW